MKLGRRGFLKVAGITATAGVAAKPAAAGGSESSTYLGDVPGAEECAVLVDTMKCVGCRGCEAACAESNGLPPPPPGGMVLNQFRDTTQYAFTVVNAFERPGFTTPRYAKKQCMQCVEPACASACPVRALEKSAKGPVFYHPERCMGCRYCMIACPFEVPKYEYQKAIPTVRKCIFCEHRQEKGLEPGCSSVCPTGALTFGKREQLLEEARRRIFAPESKYVKYIYGEHEAGGTNFLYISDLPFEKLAMKADVGDASYPKQVKGALGVPPFVMTLWPPLLMGLYAFSHREENGDESEHGPQDK
jgi:formate dehydrogenase iron-sulfur subunit